MNYPNYASTADIEVINGNIKKLVQNAKEQDTQIKSKEPIINKKTGFNLDKTDLTENDSNKLFTPKGALNLFNTLTTNFTDTINTAKEALRLDITKKISKTGDTTAGTITSTAPIAFKVMSNEYIDMNYHQRHGRIARTAMSTESVNGVLKGTYFVGLQEVDASTSTFLKTFTIRADGIYEDGVRMYSPLNKPSKGDVGLSKVDNTSDVEKNVLSATKLKTARDITIGSSTKQFDGQSNITYSLSEIGALPANEDRDILISSNRAIRVIPTVGGASLYGVGYTSTDETFNVGIDSKKLKLWCSENPKVRINNNDHTLYHTGNKPSPVDIGAVSAGKADLLWSGGFAMDGGQTLSLPSSTNFQNYQLIIVYISVENSDLVGSNGSKQLVLPTNQYGNASYDFSGGLTSGDWGGAYLLNNNQIKTYGHGYVYARRVYGIR